MRKDDTPAFLCPLQNLGKTVPIPYRVVGDKNVLDIIDAQTRAMEGLDTTAALWLRPTRPRRQRLRTYLGKPAKLDAPAFSEKKSLGVDIPAHFDELQT